MNPSASRWHRKDGPAVSAIAAIGTIKTFIILTLPESSPVKSASCPKSNPDPAHEGIRIHLLHPLPETDEESIFLFQFSFIILALTHHGDLNSCAMLLYSHSRLILSRWDAV
jgi:hypothetical protein